MNEILMRYSKALVLPMLISSLIANGLSAQIDDKAAEDAAKKNPDVELLECKVKVVDPEGFPIEDAVVFCTGLRSRELPGTFSFWSSDAYGEAKRTRTNRDGVARMSYPKMITAGATTGRLTLTVKHPDFVNYRQSHSVDDDPAELYLQRGFRIALTAVDGSTGEKIKEKLHVVTSFAGGGNWELKNNGMLVSSVMKKQDGIMRVAYFEAGNPTLFSEEIKVQPGDKSRILLKEIKLSPGCQIEGRIDDAVPRPIENGRVIAGIYKKFDPSDSKTNWIWKDEAKVEPDGTFVFESLPLDEVVQMIAICDGWVAAQPKVEDVIRMIPTDRDLKKVKKTRSNAESRLIWRWPKARKFLRTSKWLKHQS